MSLINLWCNFFIFVFFLLLTPARERNWVTHASQFRKTQKHIWDFNISHSSKLKIFDALIIGTNWKNIKHARPILALNNNEWRHKRSCCMAPCSDSCMDAVVQGWLWSIHKGINYCNLIHLFHALNSLQLNMQYPYYHLYF
jgi:hypothetical protein